jgi:hypothetical protein
MPSEDLVVRAIPAGDRSIARSITVRTRVSARCELALPARRRQAGPQVSRSQRQYRRYAYTAAIVLVTPDQMVSGRTRDMSRGGLCATLTEPIATGTDIDLDIQLVFDDGRQSEPLRVPARIVWCTSIDNDYQVGVQFRSLTGELAEYLTMFLRYLGDDVRARTPLAEISPEPSPELSSELSIDDRFG